MSIQATRLTPPPTMGKDKAPCRRCGIERTKKVGDTGYCTSCTSVLRYDPDYFANLPDPDTAQQRFRHHTQKPS